MNVVDVCFGEKHYKREFNEKEWIREQESIAPKINFDASFDISKVRLIGGIDASGGTINPSENSEGTKNIFCFLLNVYDYKTKFLVAKFSLVAKVDIPYVQGFLAYKEIPGFVDLITNVREKYPSLVPDIVMVDGNGYWHSRFCGSATQFGIMANIPTIGVSKSYLRVHSLPEYKEFEQDLSQRLKKPGDSEIIGILESKQPLGVVYYPTTSMKSCLYISVGTGLTLDTAFEIYKRFAPDNTNVKFMIREDKILMETDRMSKEMIQLFERKRPNF